MTIRLTRLFGPIGGALMALATLLAAALPAAAETAEARPAAWQKADALLSGLIETNDPGLAVLVAQDGKILFQKGYGLADREHHVPVIPQTTFRIGSIGKQFTASAILKLQEEGKLSVNDKLSKYTPDFPRGDEVTLRHLLTHTSGIKDYIGDDLSNQTNATTTEAIIETIKKDSYDFEPGAKWSYDNSGYLLLGYIVEKVSGQSYGDFLRENFFQPLGMTNTGVYRAQLGLPHEALGYSLGTNGFKRALNWDMSWAAGAGALYSTVEDLYRWNEGIFNGRVLDAASLKAAFTPVKIAENQVNSDTGYGFGWFIGRHRGLREISHGGGLPGFLSQLLRVPDEKFTVTVLANARPGKTNAIPDLLAQQLVDIYLADKFAPLPIVNTNVSPKSYDALTGRYGPVLAGVNLTISRRGTHLFGQGSDGRPEVEIFPKSETEFFAKVGDNQITFVKDSSGKVVRIVVHTDGSDLVASRVNDVVEAQKVPQLTLPVQAELEIPLAPTPVKCNGKICLVYELHVTDFQTNDLELLRVEVLGDGTNKPPLASYSDEELARRLGHVGFRLLPKDILEAFGISPPPGEPEDRIIGPGMRAVIYLLITMDREADVPTILYHRLTFKSDSPDDKPEVVVQGTPVVVHRSAPLVLGPPLRGEGWLAAGGLSNTSYHRRAIIAIGGKARIPQRFAIDWARIDEDGELFRGDRVRNSNFYAYGTEVLAVANAVVADVKDGIPENEAGSGKKAVPITLETIGGNYVILDLGKGNFALYAHLQPKSIRVRVGQKVRRGQVLALLGNSGNAEGPHLHFHVTNGNSPLGAEGVPYVFESFELQGILPSLKELGNWKPPANNKTDKRRMELPVENAVVHFP